MDATTIGKKIESLRKDRRMTQEELGKELGVSAMAISYYENGTRIPRDDTKVKIAEFFGVPVNNIFFS